MGKYTKAPGMNDFAYNSWLYKIHNKINHRLLLGQLRRDSRLGHMNILSYDGHTLRDFVIKVPQNCSNPELAIIKTRRLNQNPAYQNLEGTKCYNSYWGITGV